MPLGDTTVVGAAVMGALCMTLTIGMIWATMQTRIKLAIASAKQVPKSEMSVKIRKLSSAAASTTFTTEQLDEARKLSTSSTKSEATPSSPAATRSTTYAKFVKTAITALDIYNCWLQNCTIEETLSIKLRANGQLDQFETIVEHSLDGRLYTCEEVTHAKTSLVAILFNICDEQLQKQLEKHQLDVYKMLDVIQNASDAGEQGKLLASLMKVIRPELKAKNATQLRQAIIDHEDAFLELERQAHRVSLQGLLNVFRVCGFVYLMAQVQHYAESIKQAALKMGSSVEQLAAVDAEALQQDYLGDVNNIIADPSRSQRVNVVPPQHVLEANAAVKKVEKTNGDKLKKAEKKYKAELDKLKKELADLQNDADDSDSNDEPEEPSSQVPSSEGLSAVPLVEANSAVRKYSPEVLSAVRKARAIGGPKLF